jgi:hypothetical protein
MTTGLSRYPEPAEADSSAPLKTFPANQKKCKIGVRTGCEILSSGSGGLGVQKVNLRLTAGYALNPRTRLTTAAPNTHEPSSAHGDFPSRDPLSEEALSQHATKSDFHYGSAHAA